DRSKRPESKPREWPAGAARRSSGTAARDSVSNWAHTASAARKFRGAFVVARPEQIAGREVLPVDDVFTTGTTVSECARVLHRAGASKIYVATVARTLKTDAKDATLLRNFGVAGQTEPGKTEREGTEHAKTLAAAG